MVKKTDLHRLVCERTNEQRGEDGFSELSMDGGITGTEETTTTTVLTTTGALCHGLTFFGLFGMSRERK